MSLARLQIYVATHHLDVDPSRDLLEVIGKQIASGAIDVTPELIEILDQIEKEMLKEKIDQIEKEMLKEKIEKK